MKKYLIEIEGVTTYGPKTLEFGTDKKWAADWLFNVADKERKRVKMTRIDTALAPTGGGIIIEKNY